ncbi:hypothetical protein M877_01450 [Streptomyces niveus NCIMB 11891]|nr:hypothetical protein M877_01450 [Streptomyces niveus NCIMB 11891]
MLTPAPGEIHPGEAMMKGTPAGRMGTLSTRACLRTGVAS